MFFCQFRLKRKILFINLVGFKFLVSLNSNQFIEPFLFAVEAAFLLNFENNFLYKSNIDIVKFIINILLLTDIFNPSNMKTCYKQAFYWQDSRKLPYTNKALSFQKGLRIYGYINFTSPQKHNSQK